MLLGLVRAREKPGCLTAKFTSLFGQESTFERQVWREIGQRDLERERESAGHGLPFEAKHKTLAMSWNAINDGASMSQLSSMGIVLEARACLVWITSIAFVAECYSGRVQLMTRRKEGTESLRP